MPKSSHSPRSLSEAIEKLEQVGRSKKQDFKELLEDDYAEILKAIEEIKPHLNDLKESVELEVKKKKNEVEHSVKENPWLAIGIVGLFAFLIGLLLGHSRKD